jgi:hypothetical protein
MASTTPNPAAASEVRISLRSRYRNTRVKKDAETGEVFFAIWRPPSIQETKPPKKHRIAPDELDRPDLIATREYGDPSLFWAIALRNNLILPFIDVRKRLSEGRHILIIPHIDDVMAALQNSSPTSPGTT